MPAIRQSPIVSIPTLVFHLGMVTKALGKATRILLLSEYLSKRGSGWGKRCQADKEFYEGIFCRHGRASQHQKPRRRGNKEGKSRMKRKEPTALFGLGMALLIHPIPFPDW